MVCSFEFGSNGWSKGGGLYAASPWFRRSWRRPRTRGRASPPARSRAGRAWSAAPWISPTSLPRSSSSDGRVASALTPSGFRAVSPIAPPRITSLSLALAKSTATFGRRDRIARIGDQGRTRHEARDRGDVRAFESDLGEAVLGDLDGGAGLLHLRAQLLHFGDREARVVGHDDHARVLTNTSLSVATSSRFSGSVHWALSGWRGLEEAAPPAAPVARNRSEPAGGPSAFWTTLSQALSPILGRKTPPNRARWFEPIDQLPGYRPRRHKIRSSPSMQVLSA